MGRYVFYVDLEKLPYKSIVLGDKTIVCLLKEDLDALPIVASPIQEPKQVLNCKDCIYYRESKVLAPNKFCFRLKDRDGKPVGYNFSEYDFCSRGKKEDDNGE